MSEEGSFGLNLAEKFFGLLLLAIGGFGLYYTLTSVDVLKSYTGLFAFLSIVLIVLGFLMMIAKTE
jgi:hypothetical protein